MEQSAPRRPQHNLEIQRSNGGVTGEIRRAREILRPSAVRAGHDPRWFKQVLQKARQNAHDALVAELGTRNYPWPVPKFKAQDSFCDRSARGLIAELIREVLSHEARVARWCDLHESGDVPRQDVHIGWLDHCGSTDYFGHRAWVSEPYGVNAEDHAQIELVAKLTGLEQRVSPNSWHYPGCTMRVVFYEES